MKKLYFGLMALSVSVIAGSVLAQQPAPMPAAESAKPEACLQYNRLDRWKVVNAKTLDITDKTQTSFRVALNSDCAHSTFVSKLIFEHVPPGNLDCVEPGDRVVLLERSAQPEYCLVSDVSFYTDEQRKADEKVDRPTP